MKISISGHGGAGKDTLAGWMKENTTLSYTKSTSAYIKTEMFHHMRVLGFEYLDEEACYADRMNHRELWAEYIDLFNAKDPARLYKRCLAEQDILTGVRRSHEFKAVLDLNVIDLKIWVEMPGNKIDTTQTYGAECCDVTILNIKDKPELMFCAAKNLFKAMGVLRYVAASRRG